MPTEPNSLTERALYRLLDSHPCTAPGEIDVRKRFIALLREPRCFYRDCFPGHITGSSWIVNAAGDCALLHHHQKLDIWIQLGGHADGEEDILSVALREAEEESGIDGLRSVMPEILDLDIHLIPARQREPEHFHYDVRFLLQAPADAEPTCSSESKEICWVPLANLRQYSSEESIHRMAEKAKRYLTAL